MRIVIFFLYFLAFPSFGLAQEISENEIIGFLRKSEGYFYDKNYNQVINQLSSDFSYEVDYFVSEETFREILNFERYKNYLAIFFSSNPVIEEYSIEIINIEIAGHVSKVKFTLYTNITIDKVSQQCEVAGQYDLVKREETLQIKSLKGMSNCINILF